MSMLQDFPRVRHRSEQGTWNPGATGLTIALPRIREESTWTRGRARQAWGERRTRAGPVPALGTERGRHRVPTAPRRGSRTTRSTNLLQAAGAGPRGPEPGFLPPYARPTQWGRVNCVWCRPQPPQSPRATAAQTQIIL